MDANGVLSAVYDEANRALRLSGTGLASTSYVDSQDTQTLLFAYTQMAHYNAVVLPPAVGTYARPYYSQTTAAVLGTADRVWYRPFIVQETMTTDLIAAELTAQGGTTAVLRLNVYNSTADYKPNTKLGTDVTLDGTAGVVGVLSGAFVVQLTRGLYWMATAAQGTGALLPTWRQCVTEALPSIPSTNVSTTNSYTSYFQASVSGTLPSTATPAGPTTQGVPICGVRRAS